MKTAPLEKPSYKRRKVNEEKSGKKPCKDGSRECCVQDSGTGGVRTVAAGQGCRADPTVALGQRSSRELFLFGPQSMEEQWAPASRCKVGRVCVAPAECGGGRSFLSPLNPDHSLPSPEHPDCSSHSSSMSLMETNNLL